MRPAVPIGERKIKMDWVEKLSKEGADDARELKKKPESLASQIAAYLNNELTADQMDALSRDHGAEIDREKMLREQVAAQKKAQDQHRAAALWEDRLKPTPEENAVDKAAIEQFCQNHPNFRRDIAANGEMLLAELRANKELISTENLEKAYRALQPTGVFQETTPEEQRVQRMSAKEFKEEHASDWPDQGVPPLVLTRIGKLLDTFSAVNPQYAHTPENAAKMTDGILKSGLPISVQSLEAIFRHLTARRELELNNAVMEYGATRVVDLGGHPQGFPKESERYSLRMKIRSMTADEIAKRCLDDPGFKSALDRL
jgi:hypothetical protein